MPLPRFELALFDVPDNLMGSASVLLTPSCRVEVSAVYLSYVADLRVEVGERTRPTTPLSFHSVHGMGCLLPWGSQPIKERAILLTHLPFYREALASQFTCFRSNIFSVPTKSP